MDYYYLSSIMGHNSIAITLDTYTEFMPDIAKSMRNRPDGAASQNAQLALAGGFAATGGSGFELFRYTFRRKFIKHILLW
jgi:hypothetical protein